MELQAIGRVDRIGQHRQTTVHHFVVEDTVEEQVLHINRRVIEVDATAKQVRVRLLTMLTAIDFELAGVWRSDTGGPASSLLCQE